MKSVILVFALSLSLSQNLFAADEESFTFSTEGDQTLSVYDSPTQSFSTEQLDSEGLILKGPPGHGGGGHPGPIHGGGGPRPGPIHGGPHPGPGPRPGPWRPYPGWHNGWRWARDWHPAWWRVGMRFPPWQWGTLPPGYWQCTAFNQNMQAFTAYGPDVDQAAYGALYACGGPNYQQMGCYIPQGYCQFR